MSKQKHVHDRVIFLDDLSGHDLRHGEIIEEQNITDKDGNVVVQVFSVLFDDGTTENQIFGSELKLENGTK